MRGLTYCGLIILLIYSGRAHADTCVESARLAHSTVGIIRYFDDAERTTQSGVVGIQGTGWFQSPTTIVTVEHVAAAMGLSTANWKLLNIQDGADSRFIPVRIQRLAGARTEKLVILELQTAISEARSVAVRTSHLTPEDRLVAFAYPNQQPRFVGGRFVQYVTDGSLAGSALLEMYEGNDRLVIDHGASGAPVFDCEGRVAAVIVTVMTQIFRTPLGEQRVSTAWGTPNVISVPIQELIE